MIRVLIIAVKKPSKDVLDDAVDALVQLGAVVEFAVSVQAANQMRKGAKVMVVHERLGGLPQIGRGGKHSDRGERFWKDLRLRADVVESARAADVIVALDDFAVFSVWSLAHRYPEAAAPFGLAAAKRAVRALAVGDAHSAPKPSGSRRYAVLRARRFVARVIERLLGVLASNRFMTHRVGGRLVLRSLIVRLALGDRRRADLGHRAARKAIGARKDPSGLVDAFAAHIGSREREADLRWTVARASIAAGIMPSGIVPAYDSVLTVADEKFAAGDTTRASELFTAACELTFNRSVHFHRRSSPLAEDPERYLAPFHASAIGTLVSTPAGRLMPAAKPPTDRPLRILFATRKNANFLNEIMEHFEGRVDVEVRFFDMFSDPALYSIGGNRKLINVRMGNAPDEIALAERRLRPLIDWADTIFIDWMMELAAVTSWVDPADTRVIVRLHSYEAFQLLPHLADLSRVDDLVFVSKHFERLVSKVLSPLKRPDAPALHVLANAMRLDQFDREKSADARFTVALIGFSQVAKDPLWALEVIELLRKEDPRYRLLLVGGGLGDVTSSWARTFDHELEVRIADLTEAGAVELLGQRDDIANVLTEVGAVISASVRESFHVAVAEGAASGAVPVVRNWPFFAREAGAASVYPAEWVVDTPQGAATRILETTRDEEIWRAAGSAAQKFVLETYDWEVVQHDYDRLFGLSATPPAAGLTSR